jgi:hypothetical protein
MTNRGQSVSRDPLGTRRPSSFKEYDWPTGGDVMTVDLRGLAVQGRLAEEFGTGSFERQADLRRAALSLAYPLVFDRHTRRLEWSKRHVRCSLSVEHLDDACLDGFHDDVGSVVDYLFGYAKRPIDNLEGWLVSRMGAATVDGYRRRRGQIGALQRPRVPQWLVTALARDPWLVHLAKLILEWVGVRSTACIDLWPTEQWAELRTLTRPADGPSTPATIEREITTVLAAMRDGRPQWYTEHVERPLGAKQAPLLRGSGGGDRLPGPRAGLDGGPDDDVPAEVDRLMIDLADLAIQRLASRISVGEAPEIVVPEILDTVFPSWADGRALDRPQMLRQIIDVVVEIVGGDRTAADGTA